MPAQIFDGKALASNLLADLHEKRMAFEASIRLISLEVGQNPSAEVYVRNQRRAAEVVGISNSPDDRAHHLGDQRDAAARPPIAGKRRAREIDVARSRQHLRDVVPSGAGNCRAPPLHE